MMKSDLNNYLLRNHWFYKKADIDIIIFDIIIQYFFNN